MLAKIWKKLLLAICIIACIYNVMNKLVGRISLETQLKSVEVNNIKNDKVDKSANTYNTSKTERITKYDEDNEDDEDVESDDKEYIVVVDE